MLYKNADNNPKPNMALLVKMAFDYGTESSEVQSYLDSFLNDESFIDKAKSKLEKIKNLNSKDSDE